MSKDSSFEILLDPEFIIGTDESIASTEFWIRLDKLATDQEIRVGSATLSALSSSIDFYARLCPIATADFWKIVGRWVQRGARVHPNIRALCSDHFDDWYSPINGKPGNSELLTADVSNSGAGCTVALVTDPDCWSLTGDNCNECSLCDFEQIVRIPEASLNKDRNQAMALFYRKFYQRQASFDMNSLRQNAVTMFPRIEFSETAWDGITSLVGDRNDILAAIVEHLSILNDEGPRIWQEYTTPGERQSRLSALGVESSPESPNTHKNRKLISKYDFRFKEGVIRCEWHTKIRRNANRVYFSIDSGSVQVGLITRHL